jgi:hypothetical protein
VLGACVCARVRIILLNAAVAEEAAVSVTISAPMNRAPRKRCRAGAPKLAMCWCSWSMFTVSQALVMSMSRGTKDGGLVCTRGGGPSSVGSLIGAVICRGPLW